MAPGILFLVALLAAPDPARPDLAPQLAEQVRLGASHRWQVGIAVMSCRDDSLLFGWNEATPLKPASNQKLLVTTLALERWDDSLVGELDRRLESTPTRKHRIPANPTRADSLGLYDHPELPGYRHLVLANRESDNDEAEWMLGILARRLGRSPQDLIADHLDDWHVPHHGLRAFDACGLSRHDRVAPLTLATLLCRESRQERGPVFRSSLAVPLRAGTLIHRHLDAGDRLRAKTGYIRDVFALSGYLSGAADTFAFSFIVNGCGSGTRAYQFFNGLLKTIDAWDAGDQAGLNAAPASGQN